jgi:hypothetical protein
MTREIEVLEQAGLVTDSDSLLIEGFTEKKAARLFEKVYSSVLDRQKESLTLGSEVIDPFTFMASASMRADSTCGEYSCRLQKLDFLARYTALYANRVMLPLPLSRPEVALLNPWGVKTQLTSSVLALLHLRPLIDSGLVVPVIMRSFHCEHTAEWASGMISAVHDFARYATERWQNEFQVMYQIPQKSPTGRPTLYIEGSEDFLEHGSMVQLFDESDKWRQKSWKFSPTGKVEVRGKRKIAALYNTIFRHIANDTTFYLAFARLHSTRYLSDRPGETFILGGLTDDDIVAANNRVLRESLAHLLPLSGDLPIATLLRIRREERDAFIRYRSAIQLLFAEMMSKGRRVSKRDAQELYKEKIEPELLRIRSDLKQERRRQSKRVIGGAAALAASVAMGAFGGGAPILIKAAAVAASAMVGGRLLSKAAEEACEHGANLRQKNDFYFLLRVAQEAEML